MSIEDTTFEYENVDGIKLILEVKNKESNNSKFIKISYKSVSNKTSWAILSFLLAIVLNIFSIFYMTISVPAIIIIAVVLSFLALFWVSYTVQSESLLVIPTVGIQYSLKFLWGKNDTFISWANVLDVVINEVIKMNRVVYYLTLLEKVDDQDTSDNTKLMPLFKYTNPRLEMLERVYDELQSLLIKTQDDSTRGSGDVGQM